MGATDLASRKPPLEMTPEAFRDAGHRLVVARAVRPAALGSPS